MLLILIISVIVLYNIFINKQKYNKNLLILCFVFISFQWVCCLFCCVNLVIKEINFYKPLKRFLNPIKNFHLPKKLLKEFLTSLICT